MFIKSIELQNFRNYDYMNINFDKNNNLIYGDNAQGKTNILEAMYVCATTKSHRSNKDSELIKFDKNEAHIKMIVTKRNVDFKIDMHLKKNKSKGIAINNLPIRRAMDLFGIVNMVFFSPEDLNIIKNGPAERRRFINTELSQLDKIYMSNLANYNKALDNRNRLLKDLSFNYRKEDMDTLDIWDMQLLKYGGEIIKARIEFIRRINEITKDVHDKLSGGLEVLEVEYDPNVTLDEYAEELKASRDKDLKYRVTNCGPHKDDCLFFINGYDIRKYGSQGQKRTAALSLKLAEIELVKTVIKDNPILLLDDVLSELDSNRQNFLLDAIGDIQTIVTCTGVDEFINNRLSVDKIFRIVNGEVYKEN